MSQAPTKPTFIYSIRPVPPLLCTRHAPPVWPGGTVSLVLSSCLGGASLEFQLPRPSLCLYAEGSMRLWKPLLSLERGAQPPPHHTTEKTLCLDHQPPDTPSPNTEDVGSMAHPHTPHWGGRGQVRPKEETTGPPGAGSYACVWERERDSGKTRGKKRIKRDGTEYRRGSLKRGTAICPRGEK